MCEKKRPIDLKGNIEALLWDYWWNACGHCSDRDDEAKLDHDIEDYAHLFEGFLSVSIIRPWDLLGDFGRRPTWENE